MIRTNELRRSGRRLVRLAGTGALLGLLTLVGCAPEAPLVTVTMKPADANAAAPSETGTTPEAAPTTEAAPAGGIGDLLGTVVFEGTPPSLPPLSAAGADIRDKEVCAAAAIPDDSLIVNSGNGGIKDVFVWLEKAPAGATSAPAPGNVVFDQKGCRFEPHALLVRTTQTIMVLNDDSVAHNTHTFPKRNSGFNTVVKTNERTGVPLVYTKGEQIPLEVKCDFHSWMRAYHLPLDHSFAGLTDADGKFEIKGLPAGTHAFKIWQEKASGGFIERAYKITIKAGPNEVKIPVAAAKFSK
jgi:hypothetical protein